MSIFWFSFYIKEIFKNTIFVPVLVPNKKAPFYTKKDRVTHTFFN